MLGADSPLSASVCGTPNRLRLNSASAALLPPKTLGAIPPKTVFRAHKSTFFNRGDGITDICEIKFSNEEYTITSEYMEKLLQKKSVYQTVTKTQNAVHLVMITTFGLAKNAHYGEIQNEVTAEDLFK